MPCTVLSVKAPNGKESNLYQQLLSKYDMEKAVRYYLAAQSMDHSPEMADQNGELDEKYVSAFMEHGDDEDYSIVNTADNRSADRKFQPAIDAAKRSIGKLNDDIARETAAPKPDYTAIVRLTNSRNDKKKELALLQSPESPITNIEQLNGYANKQVAEVKRLLSSKNVKESDLTYAHQVVDCWKNASKTMATEEERTNGEFEFHLKDIDQLEAKITALDRSFALEVVAKSLGYSVRQDEVFRMANDISSISAQTLDISRFNNPLFQAAHKMAMESNQRAREEAGQHREHLGDLIKNAKKLLGNEGWLPFFQKTATGALTGNLVDRFTPEYYKEGGTLRGKAMDTENNEAATDFQKAKAWKEFFDWQRENSIVLDPRAVASEFQDFGEKMTEAEIADHRAKVEAVVGKEEADRMFDELRKKVDTYDQIKQGQMIALEVANDDLFAETTKDMTDPSEVAAVREELKRRLHDSQVFWKMTNSPFHHNEHINGRSQYDTLPKFSHEYTVSIAHKAEHMDARFDRINNSETLRSLYHGMIDTISQLKGYLPEDIQKDIYHNGLPAIRKATLESFKDHPFQLGTIIDSLKTAASVQDQQKISGATRDSDNETTRRLRANVETNHRDAAKDIVDREKIAFQDKNGRAPDKEEVAAMREQAIDQLVQMSSMNLGEIMDHFIDAATTYKYKARIEDQINILDRAIKEQLHGFATNKAGEQLKDNAGNPIVLDNLDNSKKAWDYFLEHWYGEGKPIEMKASNKADWLMTDREKKLKADLEDLRSRVEANSELTEEERADQLATVDAQLEDLGSYLAGSKVGDMLMKYMIYKSLAWNPFSAVSNVLQGVYSNLVEGSAGTHYTNEELMKAFSLTMHSLASFYSGGTIRSETSQKIRNVIEKMGVVDEVSKELYEEGNGPHWTKQLKNFSPMNMQQRSEYINQAPMIIAMMMHKKVNLIGNDGVPSEHNLWDCYDKDGNWKFGDNMDWHGDVGNELHNKSRYNFLAEVKNVMKANHGNYDALNSPLMAKKTITGRALVMFRTWIFDMAHNRFSKEWTDYTDSNGPVKKKGFYQSVGGYIKANGGPLGALMDTANQLGRKLLFQGTTIDGKVGAEFTEVDAANMRKVFTEMMSFILVTAAYYAIKGLFPDDDDKNAKGFRNASLNAMLRLQTDLMFFTNPMSAESLNQNIVPMFSVVHDFGKVSQDAMKAIQGQDQVATGDYAGTSRLARDIAKMIPFANQGIKFYSETNIEYGSKVGR